MSVILLILIAVSVYLSVEKIRERKILQKINKYINIKNEFYYKEFLKKYEKSKKIRMTERFNWKYKDCWLIVLWNNICINVLCV